MSSSSSKLRAGVLGATGTVGQRFISLLAAHPRFVLHALGASDRSTGKPYAAVVSWRLDADIPSVARDMVVLPCEPRGAFAECDVVFSGLDSNVAGEIESAFVAADLAIFSNAKNHRMVSDVPLVVPMANAVHLDAIVQQRVLRGLKRGFLVTNANCSTTGLAVVLAPLHQHLGIEAVHVVTMQAISGAGYPGVPSLDIFDNVVPYIGDEEEKIETETLKILGSLSSSSSSSLSSSDLFVPTKMAVSAACNRVGVLDGHTECVSLKFRPSPRLAQLKNGADGGSKLLEEVVRLLKEFKPEPIVFGCPSAPARAIVVRTESNRPQPRLDRNEGNGNSVVVGRIREDNSGLFDIKLVLLSHNTILGAAGSALLNAELAVEKGLLLPRL